MTGPEVAAEQPAAGPDRDVARVDHGDRTRVAAPRRPQDPDLPHLGARATEPADPPVPRPPPEQQGGAGDAIAGPVPEPVPVLPRLFKVAGAVLGSTTVLTGLLFYFGRLHVTGFFRYLRVNFTVLDLTPNDYLIRSADGLFVPLTAAAAAGLLCLWTNRFVLGRLGPERQERVIAGAAPVAAGLGAVLVAMALLELLTDRPLITELPWLGGLALAGGVLLLAYAAHLARLVPAVAGNGGRRSSDVSALAEGGFAFLLVTIGLFWAVGSYAIDVGTGRARQAVAELPTTADAVVYSERSLRLAVAGVTEFRCQDPDAAYRFRYDGLKLILHSGGQYLLVSGDWSRENGTAVLLPRDDVRLEFATPGQQRSSLC